MAYRGLTLSRILINNKSCLLRRLPQYEALRHTSHDYARKMIGCREIVGYGWSGCPVYQDRVDYPFPAIRFKEETVELCRIREKEKCDWNDLSKEDIKRLYRFSFCQTFAELQAPNPEWKQSVGWAFWIVAIVFFYNAIFYEDIYPDYPETFEPARKRAQLRRMIALEVNPVTGLTSNWDYEKKDWNESFKRFYVKKYDE